MNNKILAALGLVIVLSIVAVYRVQQYSAQSDVLVLPQSVPVEGSDVGTEVSPEETVAVTERYRGQIDRVSVEFEQNDFTRYQLVTNGVIRSGELNTERGFADDENATVYVIDWQQPEAEQLRYVKLTAEPTRLYLLNTDGEIVRSSVLNLE